MVGAGFPLAEVIAFSTSSFVGFLVQSSDISFVVRESEKAVARERW